MNDYKNEVYGLVKKMKYVMEATEESILSIETDIKNEETVDRTYNLFLVANDLLSKTLQLLE